MKHISLLALGLVVTLMMGCGHGPQVTTNKQWMGEGPLARLPSPEVLATLTSFHGRTIGAQRVYSLHFSSALRELNLSDNRLMVLPDDLVPASIQRLWLAENNLTNLPDNASAWSQLNYLNLDHNLLTKLPDLSKTALRWVRLNDNQLTQLPPLPDSVERLYAADNKLTEAPHKPAALKQLTLAGNPIAAIPEDLGAGLEWLDLSGTKVSKLPEDLSAWQTLKVLNLSRCPLSNDERRRILAAFDAFHTTVIL